MVEYDDGAYYEVQLNNKQLVFFFMAALAIAVVVFLCGVMVGRGVRDATLAVAQNDIAAGTLPKATSASRATTAAARPELDYTPRLESDEVQKSLEPMRSTSPENTASPTPRGVASAPRASAPETAPPPPPPAPRRASTLGADSGPFTIQVVALKTEDAAQSLLSRLKGKNYRAYLEAGSDAGLHRVRVGRFATRAEAETVAAKLRDEEKFRPYITQ
ncbi:MAG TPA: SPOR domain-containing protein [Vicinamibacteria bacterium]|nr:SPOR domain-containing protein [Vicinamibacteria bacterium]